MNTLIISYEKYENELKISTSQTTLTEFENKLKDQTFGRKIIINTGKYHIDNQTDSYEELPTLIMNSLVVNKYFPTDSENKPSGREIYLDIQSLSDKVKESLLNHSLLACGSIESLYLRFDRQSTIDHQKDMLISHFALEFETSPNIEHITVQNRTVSYIHKKPTNRKDYIGPIHLKSINIEDIS